ncbi:MAG TPA: GNAT family N-acetyltransferase [Candidatus Dormibacteraeota bacterium]
MRPPPPVIRLEPFTDADLPLLVALNAPEMTEHLGGPETDEQLRTRLERYVAAAASESVYANKVILLPEAAAVGDVNLWEREWQGEPVYEMGWGILPSYQGRGIASAAVAAAVELARSLGRRQAVHAFPNVANGPSNAVCRKAGFALRGPVDFEYPKGHWMRCNDWRLQLNA